MAVITKDGLFANKKKVKESVCVKEREERKKSVEKKRKEKI